MPAIELYGPQTKKTLKDIARLIDGKLVGDEKILIRGACGIRESLTGDITFLADLKYLPLLKESKASAVIVGENVDYHQKPTIKTPNPSVAFLKVLDIWKPREAVWGKGIHPKAVVASKAHIGKGVTVGAGAVIEDDCVIGNNTAILANVFVGQGCQIGENTVLYPNVCIRERTHIGNRVILHCGVVIGSDGYGFETLDGQHVKIPQVGNVWIHDDVEIGANSCVDRGRFGSTVIKKGTKIDNLVQIAHNVVIGEHCLIISQVGISGSAELGNHVTLAGQVGVVGHIKIGANAVIGAQSGVYTSVPENSVLLGSPPRPIREEKERVIYQSRLPKLFKEFKDLKKKIEEKLS